MVVPLILLMAGARKATQRKLSKRSRTHGHLPIFDSFEMKVNWLYSPAYRRIMFLSLPSCCSSKSGGAYESQE